MKLAVLIILGIVALAIIGILVAASFQPKDFSLERSIQTTASRPSIYRYLSNLRNLPNWSPWQKLDPTMKTEFQGQDGTVGSSYRWDGNSKVGAGIMTITHLLPDQSVHVKLEFIRPFPATNNTIWEVAEDGGERKITWRMEGTNDSLFARAFALLCNMDKMVGKDFEKGLSTLKEIIEKP